MNTGDNKQLFLYQWMLSFLDSWVKLNTFCGKKRDIYFTYFKNFLRISLFSFLENMNKPFHKTTRCKWKEHNMLLWHGQLIWKDLLLLVPNFCSSWFYNHFFLSYFRQSENIEGTDVHASVISAQAQLIYQTIVHPLKFLWKRVILLVFYLDIIVFVFLVTHYPSVWVSNAGFSDSVWVTEPFTCCRSSVCWHEFCLCLGWPFL